MRLTPTHSGPDSAGVVRIGNWELEGRAYLVVLTGAVCALLLFILAVGLGWIPRLLLSCLPLAGAIGIVRFFLVGRPPHFAGDWFEGLMAGRHFLQPSARATLLLRTSTATLTEERPGGVPRRRTVPPLVHP